MGYPRAVSNAETNTTSVHTPNLPIQHGTLISPSHPRSPFTLVTFLFTFRSSTYLLNNSPAPNLIAVRDTCNEIHQFISSDPTIFFFFIPKHHFFSSLTFRIIRYRVRTICYFRAILTYKLGIRNDLHRECNEPLQCHLKQKRKKPIFNLYTRDKV